MHTHTHTHTVAVVMCDTYAPGGDKEMTPLPTNTRAAANLIFNLPKAGAAVQARP